MHIISTILLVSKLIHGGEASPHTTEDCYTGDRTHYQGTVSVTENGKTCQAWSSQYPQDHGYDKPGDFIDGEVPSNFCRSPLDDTEDRPWCYTTDPDTRWEFCDIHQCQASIRYGKICIFFVKF